MKTLFISCLALLLLAGCARMQAPPAALDNSWGERKVFDYQGIKINYYEAGQGPPVILLHGFGGCTYTYRYLAPELAKDHRVFAIDLKGFGLSDKPADGKYRVADQADLVAAFIRSQDLHDLVIMGHSMGGAVTLMTYFKVREDAPARVKKLALINSAGYPQKMPWFIRFAKTPVVGGVSGRLFSPRFATMMVLHKSYYDKDKITDEQINTYAHYGSLPGARKAMTETAKQIVPEDLNALTARYKTIQAPVLIVWGEDDKVVPLEVGLKFKRDIPNSELIVLPHCGHIPLEECAGETNRAVEEFMRK